MGCGCSGSQDAQAAQQQQAPAAPALTGPNAPDYYWTGPKDTSKQPDPKPAA